MAWPSSSSQKSTVGSRPEASAEMRAASAGERSHPISQAEKQPEAILMRA
jgi:hypothetical protein